MEWKELEIDNLPPDILTGGYEFGFNINGRSEKDITLSQYPDPMVIIMRIYKRTDTYYYRKPEPKQPTHEEIMSKWWKYGGWHKVSSYYKDDAFPYIINTLSKTEVLASSWFKGRESSDMPPKGIT